MSNSRDRASLLDIASSAQKVLQYKGNMDKIAFLNDDKTQSAILTRAIARVDRLHTGNHLQQSGFPGTVGVDESDFIAFVEAETGITQEFLDAEVFFDRSQSKNSHQYIKSFT